MSPHEELKAILQDIRTDLNIVASRLDAIEPELGSIKRISEAAATVAAQTHGLVNELHTALIDTADRQGARIYALENPNGHSNGKAQ